MNKKQDWRTADKTNREAPKNDGGRDGSRQTEHSEKNVSGKKPLHDQARTENVPGTRAGQRSHESRNSGGSSQR